MCTLVEEITESDCCGNGCANCILDSKPLSSQVDLSNKSNILNSYRKYKLMRRIQLHSNVVQLKFTLVDKEQLTDFILDCPPGHHVMLRAPNPVVAENSNNKYMLRPYSPFWTDVTKFEFEIVVNMKPNGSMTKYIKSLQFGDEVEFRGPIGVFLYEPTVECRRVLIIFSHGVAIAPTIPIVQSILNDEEDMTRIYHYSCFQDVDSILFRDKLIEFNKFWNFCNRIYLSQQTCNDCIEVDCQHFKNLLRYKERIYPVRLKGKDIYRDFEGFGCCQKVVVICGSKGFQSFIKESLAGCVNKENIFTL